MGLSEGRNKVSRYKSGSEEQERNLFPERNPAMVKTSAWVALCVLAGFVLASDNTAAGLILSGLAALIGLSALAGGEEAA